ncbi:UNVERIFIED_CONTAM: hypothetical protein GTU68_017742, partial [Idotea baltica]|nr:hypothetical protein [Idotea baltica]
RGPDRTTGYTALQSAQGCSSGVFSGLLAKRTKRASPKTALVHYVAPTVWAWKPWRARKVAKYLDRIMALFPFEPPYFEREGLACDFVGHPLLERVDRLPDGAGVALRAELGIKPTATVLLVAPGSRSSEIERLAKPFGDAAVLTSAAHIFEQVPDLEVVVPVATSVAAKVLDPGEMLFEEAEARKFAAFDAADIALAASGTVTLELAAMRVPMVVGYKMPKLTEFAIRRLVKVKTGTLVNIITGEQVVPEYWQDDCNGDTLSEALCELISDGTARAAQVAGFDRALSQLGEGEISPSLRAARSVLAALDDKRQRLSTAT